MIGYYETAKKSLRRSAGVSRHFCFGRNGEIHKNFGGGGQLLQNGRKNGIIILRFDRILEKNEEKGKKSGRDLRLSLKSGYLSQILFFWKKSEYNERKRKNIKKEKGVLS